MYIKFYRTFILFCWIGNFKLILSSAFGWRKISDFKLPYSLRWLKPPTFWECVHYKCPGPLSRSLSSRKLSERGPSRASKYRGCHSKLNKWWRTDPFCGWFWPVATTEQHGILLGSMKYLGSRTFEGGLLWLLGVKGRGLWNSVSYLFFSHV